MSISKITSVSKWLRYNEFFPAYSLLFEDFLGPDLLTEEKEKNKKPAQTPITLNKSKSDSPIENREIARKLAREIIFD